MTARSRELRFESVVYVADGASDDTIVRAAQQQTRTAFGALQHSEIAVNDRELRTIDPASFVKRQVTVVSATEGEADRTMTEVRFTYVDDAVVPVSMARRSSIPSAVLAQGTSFEGQKVIQECTENSDHSREYPNWYEFNPTLASCRTAIQNEQKAIEDAQKALGSDAGSHPEGATPRIAAAATTRVYFPITVKLGADKTNKGKSYPEYQRLFAGGVEKDKLVFGFMYGLIDDNPATPADDYNFGEWMTHLDLVFKARPGMKLVSSDPEVDLSPVTLPSGLVVSDISFEKMMQWKLEGSGYPDGISYAERGTLLNEVSKRFYQSFLSFEAPVTVKDDAGERAFTVKVLTYFGVESSSGPHKRMIKNSDVYLYNGHSYIGSGPLDPGNFRQGELPEQLPDPLHRRLCILQLLREGLLPVEDRRHAEPRPRHQRPRGALVPFGLRARQVQRGPRRRLVPVVQGSARRRRGHRPAPRRRRRARQRVRPVEVRPDPALTALAEGACARVEREHGAIARGVRVPDLGAAAAARRDLEGVGTSRRPG